MSLSNDLIAQFVKVTNDKTKDTKETTIVYGTTVVHEGKTYVQLDGSELLTPISSTADTVAGERVTVMIKNHTATITGNISSPSARTDDVKGIKLDADNISKKISEFEIVVADKVTTNQLNAESARIDSLISDNVLIKDNLYAANAEIDTLQADSVVIKEQLTARDADIENLKTSKLDAGIAEITYATIVDLNASNAEINTLKTNKLDADAAKITYAKIVDLDAANAEIADLKTTKLDAGVANITYAKITDLDAANAEIGILQSDIADIDTLIFGSATGNVIQTTFSNAVIAQLGNAQIKSAMIESISADKITAGDIITNNVKVRSEDGSLVISDETMQISDSARVRVQIGKDAIGDYSINIWDAEGNLMFSKGGITDSAIKEAIIRNDMVSDTANIAAHKLDIDSLFEVINGSTNTIKSTKIYLDDEEQTLDVAFKEMTTEVTQLGTTVSSQGTQISTIQGQIASKVWQQDIDMSTNDMSTKYSTLEQKVDSISATVASHTTQIEDKAGSSTVTTVDNRVTNLEANLSGFKSTVSNTYATKTELDEINIGGRNLLKNSKRILLMSNNEAVYPATCFKMVEGDIEFNRVQRLNYEEYPSLSLSLFSGIPNSYFNYQEMTGKQVTLSFKARVSHDIMGRFMANTYGGDTAVYFEKEAELFTTEWKTFYVVVDEFPDMSERQGIRWNPYLFELTEDIINDFYLDVRDYKFELGNKATDWSPAPEDVQTNIDAAQATANDAQAAANQNAADMAAIVSNFNAEVAGLQTQIDGSITTWFYEVPPSTTNEPAKDWTTTDLKNIHLGDLYYDTITGYCYRWQVQNNSYSWQRITDTDVTKALADAKTAQDTADQKRRVFYTQPSPPYDSGDLWVQGSGGDILRCQTAKIIGQSYSSSDWVAASKYTDDTVANTANTNAIAAQSAANKAQGDIDNLSIGGRNFVLRSNQEFSNNTYCVTTHNVSSPLVPGTVYTISVNVTPAENVTCLRLFVCGGWTMICQLDMTGNDKQTVVKTFTMPSYYEGRTPEDNPSYADVQLYRYPNDDTVTTNTTIHWIKVEKGNRATDWTPAPEDVETNISTLTEQYTTLDQTVGSISATVASHTTEISKKASQETVTEVTKKVTNLETDLSGFRSTVSSSYATKTELGNAVDDIEIGGRNLVLNSATPFEITAGDYTYVYRKVYSGLEQGETYTFSAEITLTGTDDLRASLRVFNLSNSTEGAIYTLPADGTRVSQTFTVTGNTPDLLVYAGIAGSTKNIGATIAHVKVERGNKATDWTPAPEDLEIRVDSAESRLDQNDSSIKAAVFRISSNETSISNLQLTANSLTSRVSTAEGNVSKALTNAANAQTDIDNLAIGGRNLLKNSRHIKLLSNNYNLYPITSELLTEDGREFTRYTRLETDLNPTTMSMYSAIPISQFTEHLTNVEITASYLIRCSHETTMSIMQSIVIDGTTYPWTSSTVRLPVGTKWTRIPSTVTIPHNYSSTSSVTVRFNPCEVPIPSGEIENFYVDVCEWKIEKGNRATDWTPAPEDMATSEDNQLTQNAAIAAQETATNAETLVQQLSDSISMLVTDGNGTSLMTQTDSGWTFSTADIQTAISNTSDSLHALQGELGSTNNTVDVLQQAVADLGEIAEYVKISTYEDEPCIELGEGDSEFKLRITNTRILFMEGSSVIAHFTNQSLHIKKAVIEEELQQGEFVWKARSNGNLGLIWKGVTS